MLMKRKIYVQRAAGGQISLCLSMEKVGEEFERVSTPLFESTCYVHPCLKFEYFYFM